MTWPANAISETSAAAAWSRLTSDAAQARQTATSLRAQAESGRLKMAELRSNVLRFRAYRQTHTQLNGTAGLQQYARLVSGEPAFDLNAESTALLAAYAGVIAEMRALHNSLADSINAGGDIVESPREGIPAALCTPLIAALQSVEATVAPTTGGLFG